MLKHRSIASSASAQTVTQIITQKMCTLARKRAEDPTKEPRPPRGPEACNTEPQANTRASSRPTRPTPTRPTAPKAHQPPHGQQASKPHPPQPTQAASGPAEARSARRSQARHRLAIKRKKNSGLIAHALSLSAACASSCHWSSSYPVNACHASFFCHHLCSCSCPCRRRGQKVAQPWHKLKPACIQERQDLHDLYGTHGGHPCKHP